MNHTRSPRRDMIRPMRKINAGWYRLRFFILERDGYTCRYCGAHAPSVRLEVDHVVAVAEGGTDDPDNLVTSCFSCNRGKEALRQRSNGVPKVPLSRIGITPGYRANTMTAKAKQILGDEPDIKNPALAERLGTTTDTARMMRNRLRNRGDIS